MCSSDLLLSERQLHSRPCTEDQQWLLSLNTPPSVRYVMSTPLARSIFVCDRKAARNIEKSVGATTQPCFAPVLMLKGSDLSLSCNTHPFIFSCSYRVIETNLGHPRRTRQAHKPSLFTGLEADLCVRFYRVKCFS